MTFGNISLTRGYQNILIQITDYMKVIQITDYMKGLYKLSGQRR